MHQLATAFSEEQHDVQVLTGRSVAYTGSYTVHTIPNLVRSVQIRKDMHAVLEIRSWLKKNRPDCLHVHSTKAAYLGRLAAWGLQIPVIYTVHGIAYVRTKPLLVRGVLHSLEALFSRLTTKYIFLTTSDANLWRAFSRRRAALIPNGVRISELQHSDSPSTTRFLWVGRLSPPKRLDLVLTALSNLSNLEWSLRVIGEGPLKETWQKFATQLGIEDRVEWYGEVANPEVHYQQCFATVLASDAEGMPLALLEAMARKRPVIASRLSGLEELIEHGKTGYLVEHAFEPYLRRLLIHPDKAEKMGECGYELVTTKFSFDKSYQQIKELSKRVCEG